MDTILFDLDGTLLPLDMDEFIFKYFKKLSAKFSNIFEPNILQKTIWSSTNYMINNLESDKTNMDCFFDDFKNKIDTNIEELFPIFDEFYQNDFAELKDIVQPNPIVTEIIKNLKEKGYNLVVATNPLFPKEAIYQRIQWAGLEPSDFQLITTYENMHFCKPNIQYYEEILELTNKTPDKVMMVGNDMQEDMVSSLIGIKTFLVVDCLIDRGSPLYNINHRGSMKDFYDYVKGLPNL